eukprot:13871027-Heterocapsa_arctica.AAC.1
MELPTMSKAHLLKPVAQLQVPIEVRQDWYSPYLCSRQKCIDRDPHLVAPAVLTHYAIDRPICPSLLPAHKLRRVEFPPSAMTARKIALGKHRCFEVIRRPFPSCARSRGRTLL